MAFIVSIIAAVGNRLAGSNGSGGSTFPNNATGASEFLIIF